MAVAGKVGVRSVLESVSVRSGSPVGWGALVAGHRSYLAEKEDQWLVFEGDSRTNRHDLMFSPYSHRWTQGYTEKQYAEMQDFVRGAREEYDDPHMVMLPALTASTTDMVGNYRPPLDHFDQIKRSWSRGVRYELTHSMNADRKKDRYPAMDWEYIQIWEPTTNQGGVPGGYAHCHPVVVCDGPVEAERFHSVVEKHVEKCDWAEMSGHDLDKIDIQPMDEFDNPGAYLFKYLGKSWNQDDVPEYQRRFDALLYETGYRRFQPSDGARRWMDREGVESAESWLFVGIGDGERVDALRGYEDAREFRLEHERGVGAFLSGFDSAGRVQSDESISESEECSHEIVHHGQCVECGSYGSPANPVCSHEETDHGRCVECDLPMYSRGWDNAQCGWGFQRGLSHYQ